MTYFIKYLVFKTIETFGRIKTLFLKQLKQLKIAQKKLTIEALGKFTRLDQVEKLVLFYSVSHSNVPKGFQFPG